jgi:DNA-binding beta-propeller fold protein YncE
MRKFALGTVSVIALAAVTIASAQVLSPETEEQRLKNPLSSPCNPNERLVGQRCVSAALVEKLTTPPIDERPQAQTNGNPRPGRAAGGFMAAKKRMLYSAVPGSIVTYEVTTTPNGEQTYTFEKRIVFEDTPASERSELVSGMMANPLTNMIYVSTRGTLYAIDLATDKVVWKNRYDNGQCCERGAVTADGKTLVVGSNVRNFHYVIDAATGALKGKIPMPASPGIHNMNLCPDGKTDLGAPNGYTMSVADVPTMKVTKTITFTDHVRVFVINHDCSRIYANENNLLGFEVADVKSGKIIKRIEAPGEMWKAKWADPNLHFFGHGAPQHGIAMLSDESEIWVPDAVNNQVLVYDNTGQWPVLDMKKSFKTNGEPNGWIILNLDGRKAFMASGDVVDVKTHRVVAQLKDEYGRYMNSEKTLEMLFDDNGRLQKTTLQFANGDAKSVETRLASRKDADR